MLTASGVQKAHGARVLFRDVTMLLAPGRRVALVGGNGEGKTTLLEILIGLHEPDEGVVHRQRNTRIGYLPQDLADTATGTVLAETLAGAGHVTELGERLGEIEARLHTDDIGERDRLLAEYGELQSRFQQLGGYAIEADAHQVLAGLGFAPEDADRPVRELSGGWRMRVALAQLLLSKPDLMVLDEPTNHLDVDSVAWLEDHLASWPGALLFVSHDRDFIDSIATHVVELALGSATEYVGGFAEFVVQREDRLAQLRAGAAQQARKVAHAERFIERFRYKATKARQVQSRIKTLEKLELIEVPERRELVSRFSFPEPRRSSRIVAELSGVDAGYDDELVLADVNLVIERGQKVALIGPNGAGKTTLLKLILGDLAPLDGTITLGNNVDHATFAQHQVDVLQLERTVYEEFCDGVNARGGARNLRTVLGSFGFPGDAADRRVGALSGGERTRLALAKVLADPVNLLILDEPTNHLDLRSCDLLEEALSVYPGTVLLVTHDRYLIRSVADSLVTVRDGEAVQHIGVDESLLHPSPTSAPPPKVEPTPPPKAARAPAPKRTTTPSRPADPGAGKRRRDLRKDADRLERAWEKAEANVADLQRQLADPAVYESADRARELAAEHEKAKDTAATAMTTWERAVLALEAVDTDR